MITCRWRCRIEAPSISAASSVSWETPCRPAKIISMANGNMNQMMLSA